MSSGEERRLNPAVERVPWEALSVPHVCLLPALLGDSPLREEVTLLPAPSPLSQRWSLLLRG